MLGIALWAVEGGARARSDRFWTDARQRKIEHERSVLVDVAKAALPAVVSITTRPKKDPDEAPKGLGSGFIIHSDGLILTSSHVIEDTSEIKIGLLTPEGRLEEMPATVVGKDPHTDIALLRVDAGRPLPVLELSTAENVRVADWVVVIGNPFGLAHSVTVGVVSFKGRTDVVPSGRTGHFEYLQTDASINPGSSGGPMLDLNGEVVAIANAVNVSGQGIGFAIPIDIAKAVLPQLLKHGSVRRGWLGVNVKDLTPEVAESVGEPSWSGVMVADVARDSPASKAGLEPGDVIEQVGDSPVDRAHRLRWAIAMAGPGAALSLEVRRDGKPLVLEVRLGAPPDDGRSETEPDRAARSPGPGSTSELPLGASVADVDAEAAEKAGLSTPFGALVQSVTPDGPLFRAGLQEGDVVLKLNEVEIYTREQLEKALAEVPSGARIRLFVRRGPLTVPLTLRKP